MTVSYMMHGATVLEYYATRVTTGGACVCTSVTLSCVDEPYQGKTAAARRFVFTGLCNIIVQDTYYVKSVHTECTGGSCEAHPRMVVMNCEPGCGATLVLHGHEIETLARRSRLCAVLASFTTRRCHSLLHDIIGRYSSHGPWQFERRLVRDPDLLRRRCSRPNGVIPVTPMYTREAVERRLMGVLFQGRG